MKWKESGLFMKPLREGDESLKEKGEINLKMTFFILLARAKASKTIALGFC